MLHIENIVLLDVCHTAMGDGFKTCKNATVNVSNSTENYMEITASMKMAGSLTKRSNQKGVKLYLLFQLIDSLYYHSIVFLVLLS